ncbi:MAG: M13 family metallopeptidase [Thermoanaerobaculia bacterium]
MMHRARLRRPLFLLATALAVGFLGPVRLQAMPGLDLAGMDRTVAPGDDFFDYANGTWLARTEIPADRASTGTFVLLDELATERTAGLIRNADAAAKGGSAEARLIADYYAAFMDEKGIETRGVAPLRSELAAIAAVADQATLAGLFGSQLRADVDPLNATDFNTSHLFGFWVSPDFDDPERNAGYLLQGGLGLPSREIYLGSDERSVRLQRQYREHIASLLELAGLASKKDAALRAGRIFELEKKIATVHVNRTESLEVHRAHNRWLSSEFPGKAPGLDWESFFAAAGLGELPALWVWHPSAVTGIAALVASEPLAVWKDYLSFHTVNRAAPLLSQPFATESFAFYGTALSGATEQRERWKRAVDLTNEALGDAVGKLYVARYFPPEAKARGERMVANIIDAFRARIDQLSWMSPATRAQAREKLATLRVGFGYPDEFRDYGGLEVRRDDAYGNQQRSQLFDYRTAIARIGKPADKGQWWMTPQTVNAVNLPLQNAMNFPAAILEPPFFDPSTDAAQNYGGIGTVIGHEISHSFDDQGALFDARGRLANWWTEDDMREFQKLSTRLVAQYDAYEPLPGVHLNGKLTLSENIADVAGVSAAYDGYRAEVAKSPTPESLRQGLTDDQRFFLSFAQIWRSKTRPEALRNSLLTNGHSPGKYRSFTVRNLAAWYDAFSVRPGQALYLAPAERIRIW